MNVQIIFDTGTGTDIDSKVLGAMIVQSKKYSNFDWEWIYSEIKFSKILERPISLFSCE